ncbi:MAG: ASKHA domain-containing protein [Spirochaetales bacterium]|nr:ASKHA domain-containing protein [Spirochaetales bacterium]
MICRVCRHCGLCPGDSSVEKGFSVLLEGEGVPFTPGHSFLPCDIGIALDLGTTTIALRALSLFDGRVLCSFGESNLQSKYGSDVVSRISFSLSSGGLEKLRDAIGSQVSRMVTKAMQICQSAFLAKRMGRVCLKRIAVAGNTVMESLFAGLDVSGLAAWPFDIPDRFGKSLPAKNFLGNFGFDDEGCELYVAPVAGPFAGGDTVAAMLAAGFHLDDGKTKFLADIGTNCEMAVRNGGTGEIHCTSTSAGPAFEGFGIECGSGAVEGSIVRVAMDNGTMVCSVLGGGEAKSIAGTGLVSAVSRLLESGQIDSTGAFTCDSCDRLQVSGSVYLTQKDIRNFQLAKASVCSGLEILCDKAEPVDCPEIYLAGGFGVKLDVGESVSVGMIPEALSHRVVSLGNGSLTGATMLLVDDGLRNTALKIAAKSQIIDLAQYEGFQERFVSAINFNKTVG